MSGDKAVADVDGQASDDDFVCQQKTKIPKVSVISKKTFTTKRFGQKCKVGSEN